MERPKCQVGMCKNGAIVLFGNKWICGECYMKIREKEIERQNKLIEDLEYGN